MRRRAFRTALVTVALALAGTVGIQGPANAAEAVCKPYVAVGSTYVYVNNSVSSAARCATVQVRIRLTMFDGTYNYVTGPQSSSFSAANTDGAAGRWPQMQARAKPASNSVWTSYRAFSTSGYYDFKALIP